jgi:hypothetical protein
MDNSFVEKADEINFGEFKLARFKHSEDEDPKKWTIRENRDNRNHGNKYAWINFKDGRCVISEKGKDMLKLTFQEALEMAKEYKEFLKNCEWF